MVRRGSDSDSSASSDAVAGRDLPEDDAATVAPPAQDDAAGPSSPDGRDHDKTADDDRRRESGRDRDRRPRHRSSSPDRGGRGSRHRGDSPSRHRSRRHSPSPPRRRQRDESPRRRRELSPPRRRGDRDAPQAERSLQNGGPAARLNDAEAPAETAAVAAAEPVERERAPKPAGPAGGVYIPPFKLAQMMRDADDKEGKEFQRMTWDALRKSLNGLVNKVNIMNIKQILPEFFGENLVRGRGLLCRSLMKSQMASPTFTPVYAALVAVLNTKFPEIGELLLHRLLKQWVRAYTRNDKPIILAVSKFIAHLVNQQVVHELLVLELLLTLLEKPSDSSIEVAVSLAKETGAFLQDVAPGPANHVYDRFRHVMHEGDVDKRVQYTIEALFLVRKTGFETAGFPAVPPELDLVEPEDQITHEVSTKDELDALVALDVFKYDPEYNTHEKEYEAIKREVLGEDSDEEGEGGEEDEDSDEDSDEEGAPGGAQGAGFGGAAGIKDMTDTDLINLRRTIYLTIMSALDFEEAGHKLMKIQVDPGREIEVVTMILECCSQEKTYIRYYGLLAQRFCYLKREYQEVFEDCFRRQYNLIHRLETNKLRNVAKFFGHLLTTDAISWGTLSNIVLTEEATTSSARIFIKILFQELSESMGLSSLNARLQDPAAAMWVGGIFPKDTPRNMRFSINFFTSIGLGGLTDDMREHLKNLPKLIMQQQAAAAAAASSDSDSSSSDSSSSDSSSSDSDSSSSDSSSDSSSSDSSSSSSDSEEEQKLPPPPARKPERTRSPDSTLATPHRDGSPPRREPRSSRRGSDAGGREDGRRSGRDSDGRGERYREGRRDADGDERRSSRDERQRAGSLDAGRRGSRRDRDRKRGGSPTPPRDEKRRRR